jgi:DNA-binding response OmpR family regulator
MRILIAEDERTLALALARGLRREGIAVDLAHDGVAALVKARTNGYDVIVLDRGLPEIHGDTVCASLVEARDPARILMLTAAGAVDDVVTGLGHGADDYLSKPFDFDELVARVRALARRSGPPRPPVLRSGELALDPARRTVTRNDEPIELARKEFGVLEALLAAEGAVVSSSELMRRVWDENADPFSNTARMTIMTLRRKLGEPQLIETVTGSGYRIATPLADPR